MLVNLSWDPEDLVSEVGYRYVDAVRLNKGDVLESVGGRCDDAGTGVCCNFS